MWDSGSRSSKTEAEPAFGNWQLISVRKNIN